MQRQSTHSQDDGIRKRLAQEAACYDDSAASLLPEHGEAIRQEVEELLEAAVRRASLVENINAAWRSLLDTCRGQVDQDLLAWFA